MLSIRKFARTVAAALPLLALAVLLRPVFSLAESPVAVPAPAAAAEPTEAPMQTAVIAGGCFWGTQGVFEHVRGVNRVIAGYAGGDKASANYATVSTGNTGHAESVQISFDPRQISFGEILRIYFSVAHDPTEVNRQGPDHGRQYRSAIFYENDQQKTIAQNYIRQLNDAKIFKRPIATQLEPLHGFTPAESYHQDFLIKNPDNPYIVINDLPKIKNLKRLFPDDYREAAVKAGE